MLSDQDLELASSRLQDLRLRREQDERKHTDVLEMYAALIGDYRRLKSDYEEERDSREKYKQLARGQERNPFILVLVDGDGYIFDDDLISNGTEGGQRAAQLLNEVVKTSLKGRGLDHCRIMVRIYANLSGLSKAVSKVKLCGAEKRSLAPFSAGFTRSNDLFDFVDAGDMKENADYKIRAMFRQFVENAQCRHIFFAACHDVGYLSELAPFISNRDRITLVRNHAFHPEFAKLGLRIEDFPHIFRTTPLDPLAPAKATLPTQPAGKTNTAYSENVPICTFFQKGICKYGNMCRHQHVLPHGNVSPSVRTSEAKEWRNPPPNIKRSTSHQTPHPLSVNPVSVSERTGFFPILDFASKLPRLHDIPKDCVAVTKDDRRMDPYISPPSSADQNMFRRRHTKHKLCNSHHLKGRCPSGDACKYDHTPVSPGVLDCLRQLVTQKQCRRGPQCRSPACLEGHICQWTDCRYRNGKPYSHCRFSDTAHPTDLDLATIRFIKCEPETTAQRNGSASLCNTDRSDSPSDDNSDSITSTSTNGHGLHVEVAESASDVADSNPDLNEGTHFHHEISHVIEY